MNHDLTEEKMKKRNSRRSPVWKQKLLIVITVILALRVVYIFSHGEIDKQYVISAELASDETASIACRDLVWVFSADQKRLDSLELCFRNIPKDKTGVVTLSLHRGEMLIYQTNLTLTDEDNDIWKRIQVNTELKESEQYRITLTTDETSDCVPEIPLLSEGYPHEIFACSMGESVLKEHPAINFGYLSPPDLIDKLVASFLWLAIYGSVVAIIYHAELIRSIFERIRSQSISYIGEGTFICATELITAMVVVECSGIAFQPLTKILIYAGSVLTAMNYQGKNAFAEQIFSTTGKKTSFFLLCLYAAFALVGQRVFIYPLNRKVTSEGIFVFLCALYWFFPVMRGMFYDLKLLTEKAFCSEKRMKKGKLMLFVVLILLLPAALNLIANNPGISDVDTYESFEKNAQNLYGMYNWHPAFYSIILRQIQKVWNSTYAVIIAQYFFWSYVVSELLLYLRKKGLRDLAIIILAMIFGLNAANVLHVNTIWKDIPYTYSMLWLLVITAKLAIDEEDYRKRWYIYLELFVALSMIALIRKNGIVPLIVTVAAFIVVFRKNIKLIAAVMAAIIFMFYVRGPVYSHYQVIEPGRRGMYIGLGQDVLGTYYAGGEVSEQTNEMITVMTNFNTAEFDYNPTWAHQSYDLDVEPTDFITSYLDTFLKNPILMTRAVIDREDCLWDIFEGQDAIIKNKNFTKTEDGDRRWNEFYPKRVFRSIYPDMSAVTAHTVEAQWLDTIIWRCGLLSLLSLTAFVFVWIRYGAKRYLVLLAPLLGQILSLLLSTGWTDYRYFWPMNMLNTAAIPLLAAASAQYRREIF